jgi:hypothetical protein
VEIYTSEINTTDNGSVVFRILVNLVDNDDRFIVTVNVVAVGELTNILKTTDPLSVVLISDVYVSP